jgi:hypothetical protein
MRQFKHVYQFFRRIFGSKSKRRELRAEIEALRYLVKILFASIISTEPRQAAQEIQDLIAATHRVKAKARGEVSDGVADGLTEEARAKAVEVIEAVRSAMFQ